MVLMSHLELRMDSQVQFESLEGSRANFYARFGDGNIWAPFFLEAHKLEKDSFSFFKLF